MKLRCGNNSRVRSVRSCGEVETTGKARAEDERAFPKDERGSAEALRRQPGFKRKTREEFEEELPVRSGTHRATTEEREEDDAKVVK